MKAKRFQVILECECSQGYTHTIEGEWKPSYLSPSQPDLPEKETCLHCPDCGVEVEPGFKPCSGWENL